MTSLWRILVRVVRGDRRRVPRTPEARDIIRRQAVLAAEVRRRNPAVDGIRRDSWHAGHRLSR